MNGTSVTHAVFVLHAAFPEETAFVRSELVPALQLAPDQVLSSSELPVGQTIIGALENGIASSRITILVLSPNLLRDPWASLGEYLASYLAVTSESLVPLLLIDCQLPTHLAMRVSLDCRDPRDRTRMFGRLRKLVAKSLLAVENVAAPPAPKPAGLIDFTAERARHEGFVGRSLPLARLDRWLTEEPGDRWVVVTGGPGMGKSALLAAWLSRREAAGDLVPHHFIRRGQYDWDDPAKLVGSLVAQVTQLFPALYEAEGDAQMHPAARMAAMLERVSKNELVPQRRRLVLLIDGLDEYDPPADLPGSDPLAGFLPSTLSRGVSFLCASRPRHPHVDRLRARDGELYQLDLDDSYFATDNEDAVRAFWDREAPQLGLDANFIAAAVERADGNLQHAITLKKHLQGLSRHQCRVEVIPRGLAALLTSTWERIATDSAVVDGLGLLCAAREALSLDELDSLSGWTTEARRRAFVRGASELLIETQRADSTPEYRLHHDAIRAHVATMIGTTRLRRHHHTLAQRLATWPAPREAVARRYALRHALHHRVESGRWEEAWRLAGNLGFLEAKCLELGADEAELDVARAAERCRIGGEAPMRGRFDDLARVLGRESHWLREAPEATAALVWNGLRRAGWSAEKLDKQFHLPPGSSFLRLRHLATRESSALVRNLVGHDSKVTACVVTPDGRRVVSASSNGLLKVWDLDSGRLLASLEGHGVAVTAFAVTPDGRHVISASRDRTLRVWHLDSSRGGLPFHGHLDEITACAVTPDGRRVVSASRDRTLKVWALDSGRLLASLEDEQAVLACAVTPDGRCVVSASLGGELKVWDLESGHPRGFPSGRIAEATSCVVTPDGHRVVTTSDDHTLKVWDLDSGRLLAILEGHTGRVTACAVTEDGRVVSASEDRTVRVWGLESGRLLAILHGHAGSATGCAVTPDGRRMVSASDLMVKVWDLDSIDLLATGEGHDDQVVACTTTGDGQRVVSASWDKTLKVWDLDSGRLLLTLNAEGVSGCAMTPDGRRVVSASANHTLKVWDLDSGDAVTTLAGHTADVTSCAVTPDGRVVSTSWDKTLKVWDLDSGHLLTTLEGHDRAVLACALITDGPRVLSASKDGTVRLWSLDSSRLLATLEGHSGPVAACTATADGRRVISASWDKTLKVWDLESGRLLTTLQGHGDRVVACTVTPDGRNIVSASWDRTIKVWDLASSRCLFTHRANNSLTSIAATRSGLIAGDMIGAIRFLDWPRLKE